MSMHKPVRQRRAGKACENCRARKVRCDVTVRGSPCRNCEIDETPCLMARCRRGRKHKDWYIGLGRSRGENAVARPVDRREDVFYTNLDRITDGVRPSTNISTNAMAVLHSMTSLGDVPPSLDRLQQLSPPPIQSPEDIPPPDLQSLFQSFPKSFTDIDMAYLRSKGALDLPHERLRNETIRCYFEYIHPFMPLLDPTELLTVVDGNGSHGAAPRLSLLLFHCVMFAAVPFVEEALVREAGYANLKMARRAFFEKAKLLYDADFEHDSITIIQSVLLMSFWSDRQTQEIHKQTWYWVNIAISIAQTIGLNQDPEPLPLPPEKKSLRRRLWWCCFMRDRVTCLYLSRPLRIQPEDFNVALPTVEDMEIDRPLAFRNSEACPHRLLHLSCYDQTTQVELAEIFISFLKLCKVIGTILSSQYSPVRPPSGPRNRATQAAMPTMLFPVHSPSSEQSAATPTESTISPLEFTLQEWYDSLPRSVSWKIQLESPGSVWDGLAREDIQSAQKHPDTRTDSTKPSSVAIQRAMLHMCYYTAVSALHRSQNQSRHSQHQVSDSADKIAQISAFLNDKGLVRYLPVTAITMLVPSIITSAMRIKGIVEASHRGRSDPARDDELVRVRDNVNSLLVSLKTFQRVYVAADLVAMLVEAMLNHARMKIVVPQLGDWGRLFAGNRARHRAFELDVQLESTESHKTTSAKHKPPPVPVIANVQQSPSLETDTALSADLHSTDLSACATDGDNSWQELIDPGAGHAFGVGVGESLWDAAFNPDNNDMTGQWNFGSIGIDGFDENIDGMIHWDGTEMDWLA
ncbi:hypothetical protein Z517_10440 [Fonsecaea pedrosoi CBS 271.37]|uniref:Zn(2)-C6 fungal-type domain-containing protein n=1 Tax=Fonsecaea pedrosoi CBS 271.37 TaxID=1442368 RepID=A0A0D2EMS2_9EURO|nr:uncharacterized protein Z517_10440 [Fonsecaea pedrosoi CBS 271.37]KIW75697.1 hypothetical protein Z517_10440 [Fonsecaea pedrosoi CBS 271.37]